MEKWMKNSKMKLGLPKRDMVMPVKLFGDKDRDGVMNVFDCRINNRRKQGFLVPLKNPKKVRKYLPQVQTIATRMADQQVKDMKRLFEYQKKAFSPRGTQGQKNKFQRMVDERQAEDTGLFDFRAIPGVHVTNQHLPPVPEYKQQFRRVYKDRTNLPMNLIVDKGIVKGEVVTKRRSPGIVEIKSIYVLPEYRKQGLGKKVIRSMFKNPRIRRITDVAIPNAKKYWQKMGARQTYSYDEQQAWKDHAEQSAEGLIRGLHEHHIRPEILLDDKYNEMAIDSISKSGWPNTLEKEEFEKQDAQSIIDEAKTDEVKDEDED